MAEAPRDSESNVCPFVGKSEFEDFLIELRAKIGAWEPPSNEKWVDLANRLLITARVAHMTIMRLGAAETQKAVAGMRRSGILEDTMYQLAWAGDWFQKMPSCARRLRSASRSTALLSRRWLGANRLRCSNETGQRHTPDSRPRH